MGLRACRPLPIADFRHVLAVFGDIAFVFGKLAENGLLHRSSARAKLWHAINGVGHEMEAVEIVHHHLVERRARRAFFLVTMHMKIPVVGAAIGEPVDESGIAMICKDDRLIDSEEPVEVRIAQAMRMNAS